MAFIISSYVYLHHDEHQSDNWERTSIEILNGTFEQYKIVSVEERPDNEETAINSETIIKADSEEKAEAVFLSKLKGHDVDNYSIKFHH